ncbi:uncharacterized protein ASCRUDRAFT_23946, partial [Ascoidea rubescens DSM 1968]
HLNKVCGKFFRKGELIYRCLTCSIGITRALCQNCFDQSYHKGHNIIINTSSRDNCGICDCGDSNCWKHNILPPCKINQAYLTHLKFSNYKNTFNQLTLIPSFKAHLLSIFECLLDFIIDVIATSNSTSLIPIDLDLILNLNNSLNINANYTIDISNNSSLLKDVYNDTDKNISKFYLILYNDNSKQYQNALIKLQQATLKLPEFNKMVLNNLSKNGRSIVLASPDLNFLIERKKILDEYNLNSIVKSFKDFFREEMAFAIVNYFKDLTSDAFFDDFSIISQLLSTALLKKWNPDNTAINPVAIKYPFLATLDKNKIRNLFSVLPNSPNSIDNSHWSISNLKDWNLDLEFSKEVQYDPSFTLHNYQSSFNGSRFQYLVYFDMRLWKNFRYILHELYIKSWMVSSNTKSLICCQYTDIYPIIADLYLNFDRDMDFSTMNKLSTQLFSNDIDSTLIAEHGDLTNFLAGIYGLLTTGHIQTFKSLNIKDHIFPQSLRSRKWSQLFIDFNFLIQSNRNVEIFFEKNFLYQLVDVALLFHGIPVIKREAKEHVEYENPEYTIYYHACLIISQLIESITRSSTKLDSELRHETLKTALGYLILRYSDILNNQYVGSNMDQNDLQLTYNYKTIKIDPFVEDDDDYYNDNKVSFLHPLFSFMSWVIEYADFDDPVKINNIIYSNGANDPYIFSKIADYSLRTVVLIAQIKCNHWVRNGFTVRSQMNSYISSGFKEYCFSRDLYLIRVFAMLDEPDVVVSTIFDRWCLIEWAKGDHNFVDVYEASKLPYIVEECLVFFIQLLIERNHINYNSLQDINDKEKEKILCEYIKRELIHILCFKPLIYSKIVSFFPDNIVTDKKFLDVLKKISTFIPPTTTAFGSYKLKEKYYNELDPYHSYTQKYETEKIYKEKMAKKLGISPEKVVITPKLEKLNSLFIDFPRFTISSLFFEFLFSSLHFCTQNSLEELNGNKSENDLVVRNNVDGILNATLHLIHICALENHHYYNNSFVECCFKNLHKVKVDNTEISNDCLASVLYCLLVSLTYSAYHSKIRAIFKVFINESESKKVLDFLNRTFDGFDPSILDLEPVDPSGASENERKKKIAAARKAKVLAAFKRNQNKFMANNQKDMKNFSKGNKRRSSKSSHLNLSSNQEGWNFPEECCILCQMSDKPNDVFGVMGYISETSIFRNVPFNDKYWFFLGFSGTLNLDEQQSDKDFFDNPDRVSKYLKLIENKSVVGPGFPTEFCEIKSKQIFSSCGHGVHFSCFDDYISSSKDRQSLITKTIPENAANKEFLCPLCKSINNMIIPVFWNKNSRSLTKFLEFSENKTNKIEETKDKTYDLFEGLKSFQDVETIKKKLNKSGIKDFKQDITMEIFKEENCLSNNYKEIFLEDKNKVKREKLKKLIEKINKAISVITMTFSDDSLNELICNTISSIEISLRGFGILDSNGGGSFPGSGDSINLKKNIKLVPHQISHQNLTSLRLLNKNKNKNKTILISDKIMSVGKNRDYLKIINNFRKISSNSEIFHQILDNQNFFKRLISTIQMKVYNIPFKIVIRVFFMCEIFQILLKVIFNLINNFDLLSFNDKKPRAYNVRDEFISDFDFREYLNNFESENERQSERMVDNLKIKEETFYILLIKCLLPFLRRSSIYVFIKCPNDEDNEKKEIDKLCEYLKIPKIEEMLGIIDDENTFEGEKFQEFLKYLERYSNLNLRTFRFNQHFNEYDEFLNIEFPNRYKLINLPKKLDRIYSQFLYKRFEDYSIVPAICLFCNKVLMVQEESVDHEEGECSVHYQFDCVKKCGLFFLPKNLAFLILVDGMGTFMETPYLDEHGEINKEINIRRGNRLVLSEEKYNNFMKDVWLDHNEKKFITRKVENTTDIGGWETL